MKGDHTEIKDKVRIYIHEKVYAEKDKVKDDTLIFQEGFIDKIIASAKNLVAQFGKQFLK